MAIQTLPLEVLYRRCDPASLPFETTAELLDLSEVLGQARALEAMQLSVGMNRKGYNLYVMGSPGIGKHAIVRRMLAQRAAAEPPPFDWVYVNNFAQPHQPLALKLPTGRGKALCQNMEQLVEDLQDALPAAFDSDDYRQRVREIEEDFKRRQEAEFRSLQQKARANGIALLTTPAGVALAPMKDGKVLSPDEFADLPQADKEQIERVVARLQEDLQQVAQQMPRWRREHRERVKALNDEVALAAVGHIMSELRRHYQDLPPVLEYLDAVQQSVLDNVDDFLAKEEGGGGQMPMMANTPSFRRYA